MAASGSAKKAERTLARSSYAGGSGAKPLPVSAFLTRRPIMRRLTSLFFSEAFLTKAVVMSVMHQKKARISAPSAAGSSPERKVLPPFFCVRKPFVRA